MLLDILVTRVARVIGRNLIDSLLEKVVVVIGIDKLFNGRLGNFEEAVWTIEKSLLILF